MEKEELIILVSGSATVAIDNLAIEEFSSSGPTANEVFSKLETSIISIFEVGNNGPHFQV